MTEKLQVSLGLGGGLSINGIGIDVRAPRCLYVKMDDWTFYIDNSTDEAIMERWISYEGCIRKGRIDNRLNRFDELTWAQQETIVSLINHIASIGPEFSFGAVDLEGVE